MISLNFYLIPFIGAIIMFLFGTIADANNPEFVKSDFLFSIFASVIIYFAILGVMFTFRLV